MDKILGKIQHKLGVEGTGPEGYKGGIRSDACKSFWGQWLGRLDMKDKTWKSVPWTMVRGIGHERENLWVGGGWADITHGGKSLHIDFGDIVAVMFEGFHEG